MDKTKYKCTTYFEAVSCDCGGSFVNEISALSFLSNPPQKEFGCRLCGKTKVLHLEDFPQMKIILGDKTTDDTK
jgi:hypothetical protein